MKLYFYFLESLRVVYKEVFKEKGEVTFTISLYGAFFLISQVGFFYEILEFVLGTDLPFPEKSWKVILIMMILTSLNYYFINQKKVIDEFEVKKKTSILIFTYLMVTLICTFVFYFNQ